MEGMKKRILLILKGFPRLSETFILQELLSLAEDFELVIYSLKGARESLAHSDVAKLRAEIFYQNPRWDFHSQEQIEFCLERIPKVDLVYAHFLHDPARFGVKIANSLGVPFVCSGHAVDIYTTPSELLSHVIAEARKVFVCHPHGANFLREKFPEFSSRIIYLPHGINASYFEGETERSADHFLSVGRLVPKKGYEIILRALSEYKNLGHHFQYTVIGEGEMRGTLEKLCLELKLGEHVNFLGAATREVVRDYYKKCSALLMSPQQTSEGNRDGIPNVLLEAMASSLPVIVGELSGLEAIAIPGETAQVFRDPIDLVLELENFGRSDPEQVRLRSERALKLVRENFDSAIHLAELKKRLGQELS